jgi:hypothetical protein
MDRTDFSVICIPPFLIAYVFLKLDLVVNYVQVSRQLQNMESKQQKPLQTTNEHKEHLSGEDCL